MFDIKKFLSEANNPYRGQDKAVEAYSTLMKELKRVSQRGSGYSEELWDGAQDADPKTAAEIERQVKVVIDALHRVEQLLQKVARGK